MVEAIALQKDDSPNIIDEFLQLEAVANTLAILRDGTRNASTNGELAAWQNIVDMTLEYEVGRMNEALTGLCKQFPSLKFNPVLVESYSLLRKIGTRQKLANGSAFFISTKLAVTTIRPTTRSLTNRSAVECIDEVRNNRGVTDEKTQSP